MAGKSWGADCYLLLIICFQSMKKQLAVATQVNLAVFNYVVLIFDSENT